MNQTVIITGASRGIGREIAIRFAEKNNNVVLNYLNSHCEINEVALELEQENLSFCLYRADVSNRFEVDKMVDYCIKKYGQVDVLVNNAGISEYELFTNISEDQWDKMMSVNLKGAFNCTQSVLKYMLPNKKGRIINISSIWGITGAACEVHYSVSKAGLIGMTKALAKELGPSNITVNCIAPGIIETDMIESLTKKEKESLRDQTVLGRFGTCGDIANCVMFLASDDSAYLTGQIISPNGGYLI